MSANEELFKNFLETNYIEYKIPKKDSYSIDCVPFNKSGIYKPDFYIPCKDLYIEIKGLMTLYAVNKLKYLLLKRLPLNFCILQMTDETWISEVFNDKSLTSIAKKLDNSIQQQFKEIKKLSAKELHDLSLLRLDEYLRSNQEELEKWLK